MHLLIDGEFGAYLVVIVSKGATILAAAPIAARLFAALLLAAQ